MAPAPDPQDRKAVLRRRNRRLALILVVLAVGFYVSVRLRWGSF